MAKFDVGEIVYANALGIEKAHLKEFVSYLIVCQGIDPKYVKVIENDKKTAVYYLAEYFFRKEQRRDDANIPF